MLETILFTVAIVLVFSYYYKKTVQVNGKVPPGPFKYPILGNIPQIASADPIPYLAFEKLAQKYGNIFSVRFGTLDAIVVSTLEDIREIFSMEETTPRLRTGMLDDRAMNKDYGILTSNGEAWKEMRRFTIRNLRDFGLGKRTLMGDIINNEVNGILGQLEKKEGTPIPMHNFFTLSILNVLWSMMTGTRFEHDDPKLLKLLHLQDRMIKTGVIGAGLITAYPFIRHIFPKLTGYREQMNCFAETGVFLKELLNDHKSREARHSDPQGLVDSFCNKIDSDGANPQTIYTDDNFIITGLDLFQAGSQTTSKTLAWALLYTTLYPEIQRKVQKEIDEVTGGRIPELSDRDNMPYINATILEVYRRSNVSPLLLPRVANTDVHYKGYVIPKGTAIFGNLHSVFYDKDIWGDPENFRPERYLDENNSLIPSLVSRTIAFGVGKRQCIGMSLADATIFLYFTSILQRFDVTLVPGESIPSLEPQVGFSIGPKPFNVLMKKREELL